MYTAHFGLNSAPFTITPDPHYLYLSSRHREALAHLLYGVNEGPGFVLLTGEVGTGKTTLCRCLIEQLPDTVDVAFLLNPRLSPPELLAALFDELRISYHDHFSLKDFIDTLHSYLLTAHAVGRRTVLILDEAQNLTVDVLEQVRLLTNLETASHKLLQIILVGQPELKTLLKQSNLRQVAQRITAQYHLLPLPVKETQAYISHRLTICGARTPLFTPSAMNLIHRFSGGVPRLINVICDRSLLGGYVNNKHPIDNRIVRKAIQEIRGNEAVIRRQFLKWFMGILFLLLLFGGTWWGGSHFSIFSRFHKTSTEENKPMVLPTTSPSSTESIPVPNESSVPLPTPLSKANLPDLLKDSHVKSDTETAFVTLFRQWQVDYHTLTGKAACDRAATAGLVCLYKTGSWGDLRRFNRPAIIELVTESGTQYHAVVSSLQENSVTLNFAEKSFDFSLSDVNQYWLGQFLLLWHPPQLPIPVVRAGITNETVVWVRKHLAHLEGNRPPLLSATFDQNLKKKLIMFQQKQGLSSDGIAGEETLLALQAFSDEGPLLKQLRHVTTTFPNL